MAAWGGKVRFLNFPKFYKFYAIFTISTQKLILVEFNNTHNLLAQGRHLHSVSRGLLISSRGLATFRKCCISALFGEIVKLNEN